MPLLSFLRPIGMLLCCSALITGCKEQQHTSSTSAQSKKLVVVTSADTPPFSYHRLGRITGFEIALIKKIAKELGTEIEIRDAGFETLLPTLQKREADLAISALEATPDRQIHADFSKPYYRSTKAILVPKGSPIQKVEDLVNQIIGAQTGTTYESYVTQSIQSLAAGAKVHTSATVNDLIQALKNKQIGAIIAGAVELDSLIKNHPDFGYFELVGSEADYAIAFPKGSDLVHRVNTILDKFSTDGTIESLKKEFIKS
jgi:ABC-type amino acid transport substrate-binding protein